MAGSRTASRIGQGPRRVATHTGTITLIAAMICLALGGFIHLSDLMRDLERTRAEAAGMQAARHALTKAGHAVASALVGETERPDLSSFNTPLAPLAAQGELPVPAAVRIGNRTEAGREVMAALMAAWRDVIPGLHRGEFEGARQVFDRREAAAKLTAIERAYSAEIAGLEQIATDLGRRVDVAMRAVALLEVLAGMACIVAFAVAARRTRREAHDRALDVSAANASREQVSRLFAMADMLQSAADQQDANAILRATATELIPDLGGALYVFSNSRDRLRLSTIWGLHPDAHLPDTIGVQQCWALKRGKPHLNVPNSSRLACEHFSGPDCVLEIPMAARGEILGLLQIHAPGANGEARIDEVRSLGSALADGMSLALANLALRDQLRSQALRDPLTGLYNRRYMEDALTRLAGLAERDRHDLSVIMIDLDHFKRLNDNHGHAKGDSTLRDVAAVLSGQIRETDIACRYGGEELIVVLPSCSLEKAQEKAEQMRLAIEAMSEPNGAQVSASMGVASIPATSVATRDLLSGADAALYAAKQGGRNRVAAARRRQPLGTGTISLVAAE